MKLLQRSSAVAVPLLLVVLTAIAGYAFSRISSLSLPIPFALAIFTVLLPLASHLTNRLTLPHLRTSSPLNLRFLAPFALQLIYETVVLVLSLTYMVPPSALNCGLESRWKSLFIRKDGNAIKAIQDALNCCGFNSVRDRAWPFVGDAKHERGCVEFYGRTGSCAGAWRREEQIDAGLLLLVAVVLFLVKVLNLAFFMTNRSWAPKWMHRLKWHGQPDNSSLEDNRASMRRLIEQGSAAANEGYHDEPETGAQSDVEEQRPRVEPSPLAEQDNEWRNE